MKRAIIISHIRMKIMRLNNTALALMFKGFWYLIFICLFKSFRITGEEPEWVIPNLC